MVGHVSSHFDNQEFSAQVRSGLQRLPSDIDLKSSILQGVFVGALVFTVERFDLVDLAARLGAILKGQSAGDATTYLALMTAVSFAAAILTALAAVYPQTSGSGSSSVSYRGISTRSSAQEYVEHISKMSPEQKEKEILEHCFELARLIRRKLIFSRIAIFMGFFGLVTLMLALMAKNAGS